MLLRQEIELVDDLIAAAQMPAGQVLAVLTMLEIKGVVTRLPGKRVTLK
jgi:predicted Rossmann fold nucleotide-binding protein DprA/Smf involved in DNA uptake